MLRFLSLALVALFVGVILFAGSWRVAGGRWEVVRTPSMGTVAPVGSLIWTLPVDASTLRVGDFISFHPPGQPRVTYSHRVWKISPDGTIQTKGVIPAPDAWKLRGNDIVGKVRMVWPGAGWLLVCAPLLGLSALLILGLRRILPRSWRLPATLVLVALALDAALVVYKPLLNAQIVGSKTDSSGVSASFVSTGLLPLRVTGVGGSSVVIEPGEVGTVRTSATGSDSRYHVNFASAIPWWLWVAMVLAAMTIPLYGLVVGFAAESEDEDDVRIRGKHSASSLERPDQD
ncbi:hypothetical protein Back2_28950 [Nocardioides baekrokdamisoli]|uniref:Peptidase S26 domain-containing protein n=1 Tax=Nocardioides baekrokdamisoli TaxID=1804624 RepID=A0A3G9J4M5_9ACTN|nr:S26 family signal peptidase [Nocardioides baekrokdamisoli]BBH18608.1 hypothetical protein Back2_28950 [Nocardioides baekrokdamisoli]